MSAQNRHALKFIWDVVFGRILPLILFACAAISKGQSAMLEQGAAADSLRGAARFADDLGTSFLMLLLALTYMSRLPRLAGKRSPLVVLVVAGPFVSLAAAIAPHGDNVGLELAGATLIAVGTAYSFVSLYFLRSAFSILPEARALITRGPFALSRHPLYLGEAIATIGQFLPLTNGRILLLIPYFGCQLVRMRWEEDVLALQFPEYAEYAARVPRYLPFLKIRGT